MKETAGRSRRRDSARRLSWRRPKPLWFGTAQFLFLALVLHLLLLFTGATVAGPYIRPYTRHLGTSNTKAAASMPTLFVHGGLAAPVGSVVDVPIAFDSGGTHVAALSFSLGYDHGCLALDLADQDKNGLPDAITFNAPGQFFPSIAASSSDYEGRIDVVLADYIPPLAALHDTIALVTIRFRIVCPVPPGLMQNAHLRFAAVPAVGFSGPTGHPIAGASYGGTVQVIGALPEPSPTLTQTTPPPPPPPPSPTPTPGGTIPPPQVALEIAAWPERMTRTDRSVFLILDYIVLMSAGDATISALVPQAVQVDATSSTPGWLCETSPMDSQCLLLLPRRTLQHNPSGRLFLAMEVDSPLLDEITQLDFAATLQTNDGLSSQTQHLILPVLSAEPPPTLSELILDLVTETSELVTELDHQLSYTLTYTNTSNAALQGVEFHLIVPATGAVRSPVEDTVDWHCLSVANRQSVCTLQVDKIEPGAPRQQQFVLELEEPAQLQEMSGLAVAIFATRSGKILSTASSLVPIRQYNRDKSFTFLPLVEKGKE